MLRPTKEFLRLRWIIKDDSVASCVSVIKDTEDPTSPQQPFQDSAGELHEIASAPFCDPPVAHHFITIGAIIDLEEELQEHRGNSVDYTHCVGPELQVVSQGNYITIAEYVNAVHPWLVRLRGRILQAQGEMIHGEPLPWGTELRLYPKWVDNLSFSDSWDERSPRGVKFFAAVTPGNLAPQSESKPDDALDEDHAEVESAPSFDGGNSYVESVMTFLKQFEKGGIDPSLKVVHSATLAEKKTAHPHNDLGRTKLWWF